jgi:hypothetical protein
LLELLLPFIGFLFVLGGLLLVSPDWAQAYYGVPLTASAEDIRRVAPDTDFRSPSWPGGFPLLVAQVLTASDEESYPLNMMFLSAGFWVFALACCYYTLRLPLPPLRKFLLLNVPWLSPVFRELVLGRGCLYPDSISLAIFVVALCFLVRALLDERLIMFVLFSVTMAAAAYVFTDLKSMVFHSTSGAPLDTGGYLLAGVIALFQGVRVYRAKSTSASRLRLLRVLGWVSLGIIAGNLSALLLQPTELRLSLPLRIYLLMAPLCVLALPPPKVALTAELPMADASFWQRRSRANQRHA